MDQLRCEIESGNIAPDKRKGYCFQRAGICDIENQWHFNISSVALELVNPSISNLWKLIIQKISKLGIEMSPVPVIKLVCLRFYKTDGWLLFSRKIKLFAQDSEIVQDRVCIAQDVKVKGLPPKTRKTGDIAGIRARDKNGNIWPIYIETKNSKTNYYLNNQLDKFYEHVQKKKETNEICIYLSLFTIENPSKNSEILKNGSIFLVIHGLEKEDCTLDIEFFTNFQQEVTVEQLLEKFYLLRFLQKLLVDQP